MTDWKKKKKKSNLNLDTWNEENSQSVMSIVKPLLLILGSPSPLTRTYFPPHSHSQSTSGNHYSRRFLAVSTFSIVVLLWMQHICCMVLGTPLPYWPFQNQHDHSETWPSSAPKTNRPQQAERWLLSSANPSTPDTCLALEIYHEHRRHVWESQLFYMLFSQWL